MIAAAADEFPVDRLRRMADPPLVPMPTMWPRMRCVARAPRESRATRLGEAPRSRFRWAQPEVGVPYPYGRHLGWWDGKVSAGVRRQSPVEARSRLDASARDERAAPCRAARLRAWTSTRRRLQLRPESAG